MYLIKMNAIPKLKCCFFETFEAEINKKEKGLFLKSMKTGKEISIKIKDINYLYFCSGKIIFGLFLLLIGFYNYYSIISLNKIIMILILWTFINLIAILNRNLDEDLFLFVSFVVFSIILYFSEENFGGALDYLSFNTFFFISSAFIVKGFKEYLYDRYTTAISLDNKFIFKIKKIKKEI